MQSFLFFICHLVVPLPTLAHYRRDSLTHCILIRFQVQSVSLAECLVEFKLGTFQFIHNVLTHWPLSTIFFVWEQCNVAILSTILPGKLCHCIALIQICKPSHPLHNCNMLDLLSSGNILINKKQNSKIIHTISNVVTFWNDRNND